MHTTDILMVVHARPEYLQRALGTLVQHLDARARIWIWQNGEDVRVRDIVDSFSQNGVIARYCQSRENAGLREPFNWLLSNSSARFIGKVDDDCLVPPDFLDVLLAVHQACPRLAALSAWNYGAEDYDESSARHKLEFIAGRKVLFHPWVGGGSFIAKAAPLQRLGLLRRGESFPNYCTRLAWRGWLNAWCVPPMFVDHMDDPRSPFTVYQTDADVEKYASLTMKETKVATRQDWIRVIQQGARAVHSGGRRPGRMFWPRMFVRLLRQKLLSI